MHSDSRGYFYQGVQSSGYREAGNPGDFVQDNVSYSRRGELCGLHFQNPEAQAKPVSVLQGSVYDVVVDLRLESPTFGEWESFELTVENGLQLFVPEGFAQGFVVTGDSALFFMSARSITPPGARSHCAGMTRTSAFDGLSSSHCFRPEMPRRPSSGTYCASDSFPEHAWRTAMVTVSSVRLSG